MVKIAPTLETMAGIYALTKQGGATSPRFRRYLSVVEQQWGLAAYNPMGAAAAEATVQRLLELDAEAVAKEAAGATMRACESEDEITLAVVVRAPGMWTDRVGTEVEYRASPLPRQRHGLVTAWSPEGASADDIRRESAAEGVRVIWTAMHGRLATVRAIVRREGLAYAIAEHATGVAHPYGSFPSAAEEAAVAEALDLLGNSEDFSDVGSVLFGDDAASALGWTTLGVPHAAGYRWAIARALEKIADLGIPRALRAGDSAASAIEK